MRTPQIQNVHFRIRRNRSKCLKNFHRFGLTIILSPLFFKSVSQSVRQSVSLSALLLSYICTKISNIMVISLS